MRAARYIGIVVAMMLLVILFNLFQPSPRHPGQALPYSDLLSEVAAGRLREAVISGRMLQGVTAEGRAIEVYLPDEPGLARELAGKGVRVRIRPEEVGEDLWIKLAGWSVYWIAALATLFYFRRIALSLRAIEATVRRQTGAGP